MTDAAASPADDTTTDRQTRQRKLRQAIWRNMIGTATSAGRVGRVRFYGRSIAFYREKSYIGSKEVCMLNQEKQVIISLKKGSSWE